MLGPNGFLQGYNAQIGFDADSRVIVAQALVNVQNDGRHMGTLLDGIRRNCGRGINAFIAVGRQLHGRPVSLICTAHNLLKLAAAR